MILSKGDIWRLGQRIKDMGERMAHVRIFGVHIFNITAGQAQPPGLWRQLYFF
jgi:hypothetical protein